MSDPEWGDEVAENDDFLDVDLEINGQSFNVEMRKLMALKLGNLEFYSPNDVAINLEKIGYGKLKLTNMKYIADDYRKSFDIDYAKARRDAEPAILEKRRRDKENGLRKDIGGSITKPQIDDWVVINKPALMMKIHNADRNIEVIKDNYQLLVERSSELKNIMDLARDEWKNVGQGGIKKDGFEDK